MTFKDKIKSMLHSSGHKKDGSSKSPTTPAAPAAAKPDPNRPPNARDPGFRKSFNLGEPQAANGSANTEAKATEAPVQHSEALSVPPASGKEKMYTLDKYGEDYLAVSPRTNATVPDSAGSNQGLSTVKPLDDESNAALGTIHEHKQNDPVTAAAQALDTLPSSQKDPNFGRDQFAQGERKDSGFLEPAPTRDATNVNSPETNAQPVHPTALNLESSSLPESSSELPPISKTSTTDPSEVKSTGLLPPPIPAEDGASSVYSDDSNRPPLQQIASSVYSQPASDLPTLNETALPTATEHQQNYTSLVSDVLPISELPKDVPKEEVNPSIIEPPAPPKIDESTDLPTVIRRSLGDSSEVGQISPPIQAVDETNSWSQGLIADLSNVKVTTPEPTSEAVVTANEPAIIDNASVPDTALQNPEASVDQQAEAFANIVSSHVESLTEASKGDETQPIVSEVPDVLSPAEKPIITTTNTVPHADAAHMGDLPEILKEEEEEKPLVKVEPVPPTEALTVEESVADEQIANKSQLLSRPALTHDDSVYAITKDIPGAL
ncbi:hypothetical protein TWF694_009065 [Orbilia ellipsospora]|uniref:Uncharacterized protein n=1 Tax=Orbilia ellipsospora TaxID=2528407 RepID=A0AAV9XDS0_9PEZI